MWAGLKRNSLNVSFDSRVHLWPRESAWCKISPVKAEAAPLEHNYKNNDCFQRRFPKNLPIFLRFRYVCNTSQHTLYLYFKMRRKPVDLKRYCQDTSLFFFWSFSSMFRQSAKHDLGPLRVLHKTQQSASTITWSSYHKKGNAFCNQKSWNIPTELPRDITPFRGIWQTW